VISATKHRLDPVNARKNERRPETGLARRQHVNWRRLAGERFKAAPQIGKDLVRHSRSYAASISELAGLGVEA
jgi:hypothetical protein